MNNISEGELICSYTAINTDLVQRGLQQLLQKWDNEVLAGLKIFMRDESVDLKPVTPHLDQRNAAEWEIKTSRNHFIEGLISTDKNFPMHLWDWLIFQATMALNLLRQPRTNPRIYVEEQINVPFDLNRTPLPHPRHQIHHTFQTI